MLRYLAYVSVSKLYFANHPSRTAHELAKYRYHYRAQAQRNTECKTQRATTNCYCLAKCVYSFNIAVRLV